MTSRAVLKHARVSPQKARLVADLVRGRDAAEAVEILSFLNKKSAPMIRKLVESAISNAEVAAERDNAALDIDDLYIETIYVDQGPTLRRFRPRAQGRATRIIKKTSHITVELATR
jgi:large subunit ribosomal protein L22